MDRLTLYMLRQSLGTAIFVTAALTAAIWLTQSLRLVDLIVNRGLSAGLFFYLGVLTLPRFVEIVMPIGIFIAVLFTYNRLITESEIVVMRAAGVSQFGLAKPALALGAVGMVLLFSLSAYFLPTANRAFKDLQFQIRNKFAAAIIQEGTFTAISENLTVFVRTRETNGELTGFLVQDERDRVKPVTIVADRGAFVAGADGSRILLINGNRQQLDRATGKLSVLSFDKYTLDIAELHDGPEGRAREPQERYFSELLFPTDAAGDPQLQRSLLVEANQRLVTPLTVFSLTFIALAALLCGEFNRRGQIRRILLAVLLAFLFEAADLGLRNLATRSPTIIPLIYLNAMLPMIIAGFMLFHDPRRAIGRRGTLPAPAE
jgi:lipopolysaccharide export system permease protein